jgi:putative ATP-dependent endonuclease of OLD family
MKIRHIKINNFRGIKELEWALPDRSLLCLIGRGDSTKSTILEAIRFAFYPQWNLSFDDSDFFLCKTDPHISIEITIGDLPEEFLDLTKFGQYLRGWNTSTLELSDEPGSDLEEVLTIELQVDDGLEPKWQIINDRQKEGTEFRTGDRAKAAVGYIGAYSDRNLTWSKGSVLSQLTEAQNIGSSLAGATRAAKDALDGKRGIDLIDFDATAAKAEKVARELGVSISQAYKAHLDVGAINIKLGGLALHDGDIPLRQLGLGSRRMLTCGLQKQTLKQTHITLFDEIEMGLEPSRIARLLKHIKEDKSGQYFLTTHSPVVLRELTVSDLYLVRSIKGTTEVVCVNKPPISESVQGNIRSEAEAFLSHRVIVCEGATEVGLCRGLDNYWLTQGKETFSYRGVACMDANGAKNVRKLASNMKELGYDVAIFIDSDSPQNFSQTNADELIKKGISVISWDDEVSVEQRIISDIPWSAVLTCIDLAINMHNETKIVDQISTQYGPGFERDRNEWSDTLQLRDAIGKAAKKSEWFKRQDRAEEWFDVFKSYLHLPELAEKDFVKKIGALRTWIDYE